MRLSWNRRIFSFRRQTNLIMNQQADSPANDFSDWLKRFEQGDPSAAEAVVDAYYERLVRLARRRLAGMPPQVADDEGAVVSALRSFFSGIEILDFFK